MDEPRSDHYDSDGAAPQLPTPKRNLLTFSKVLPSSLASPSSSILKRKLCAIDDATTGDSTATVAASPLHANVNTTTATITTTNTGHIDACSTPVLKKKRVSFHDPPVSVTKEYIGHADEHIERPSFSKMMQQHQQQQQAAAAAAAASGQSPLNRNSGKPPIVDGSGGSSGRVAQTR